ncbi:MAG: enoyl-CoA hydratase/isomerase family protein [Candidatus Jordarchaeum sp.]|uniref:enoyl-CoA hydratase/isomerase family protein n=1 Tax=Candidatus Jordarchaeum sp. TaxID=2823881 RepID=UPI00404A6043
MSEKLIIVGKEGNMAIVMLNREKKRNALSVDLRKQLTDTLLQLAKDNEIKAVILTGKGPVFSAGFDTSEFMSLTPENMQAFFEASWQYHVDVMTFPKPLIAALNGPAIAGGLDLALMCDFRIASETAFFQHPEIKFGATPLYTLLKPVVGDGLARDLSFTGRRIEVDEALRIGLVNKVVSADKVLEEAKSYAAQICESKLETLMAVKKMCIAATNMEEFSKITKTALGG